MVDQVCTDKLGAELEDAELSVGINLYKPGININELGKGVEKVKGSELRKLK